MKTKIIQSIPALLALAAIGFRYGSNWCIDSATYCYGTWAHQMALSVTKPLYFFALYSIPLVIILTFIPRHIFNSWLKLAVWALPLVFIFIATTPVSWTGIGMNFFPFYRDDAARLAGQVFVVVSLILIGWKYIAAWRNPK